jgi:hypothetical protein
MSSNELPHYLRKQYGLIKATVSVRDWRRRTPFKHYGGGEQQQN